MRARHGFANIHGVDEIVSKVAARLNRCLLNRIDKSDIELGGLTVAPVAIGMVARAIRPSLARLERPLSAIASILIVVIVVADGFRRPDPPTELVAVSFQPSLWLALAATVLGIGVPRLLRQSAPDATAIGVELCMKNGLLGLVVVSSTFGVIEPSIPILMFTSLMIPVSASILVAYRIQQKRADGPPAVAERDTGRT